MTEQEAKVLGEIIDAIRAEVLRIGHRSGLNPAYIVKALLDEAAMCLAAFGLSNGWTPDDIEEAFAMAARLAKRALRDRLHTHAPAEDAPRVTLN
jgi:hypothetical protein